MVEMCVHLLGLKCAKNVCSQRALKRNVLEMCVHKGPLKNGPLKCVNLEMCQKCGHFSEMCLRCVKDVMKIQEMC